MKRQAPHRTLLWALGISLVLHVALLTLRFAAPQTFNRIFQDTPLEVVLVNARSNERPQDAQALAQVSLAGGGQCDGSAHVQLAFACGHHQRVGLRHHRGAAQD